MPRIFHGSSIFWSFDPYQNAHTSGFDPVSIILWTSFIAMDLYKHISSVIERELVDVVVSAPLSAETELRKDAKAHFLDDWLFEGAEEKFE